MPRHMIYGRSCDDNNILQLFDKREETNKRLRNDQVARPYCLSFNFMTTTSQCYNLSVKHKKIFKGQQGDPEDYLLKSVVRFIIRPILVF